MIFDRSFLKYKRYYTYIEPLFRSPVLRTYTALILSLITVSFFTLFAIRPTIKTIVSLNKQIEDGKFTDNKLQEKINNLSLAQTEYNAVTPDLPVIGSVLPNNPSVPPFAQTLERIVAASGVTLSSFQLQTVRLLEPIPTTPVETKLEQTGFTMVITGGYKNLLSFLDYIKNIQRLVVLDTISVSTSRARLGSGALSLSITGKLYFFK